MLKVIGIGSPFGDDQIGLVLIEELRKSPKLQPLIGHELILVSLDRPGAALLSEFEGIETAIVIDAVVSDSRPGQLHCWTDPSAFQAEQLSLSSHGLGLAQALVLGQSLGQIPAQLLILGVEVAPDQGCDKLSQSLSRQIPMLTMAVVEKVLELIRA